MDEINEQVFRFLEGEWAVRRRFEGSYEGAFTGQAHFKQEADGLTYRYTEQGRLTDGEGQGFDAKQSYRYRLEAGKLQVLKREASEWAVMHDLDFVGEGAGKAKASHVHLCGQDHYAATCRIDFAADTWELAYAVSGPKKDYRIRSVYRRSVGR
jgi:hypothetical protein